MADINFRQSKIYTWEDHREYQKKDENNNLIYLDTENNETLTRTDKPLIISENYQRTEIISGARIISTALVIVDNKQSQKIRVELKFADGITTHAVDFVLDKNVYDAFEDDIECLKSAINSKFTLV